MEFHLFFYYPALARKTVEITLQVEEVMDSLLSAFVAHEYLQHGAGVERVPETTVSWVFHSK